MSMINSIQIKGVTHELPSGASAIVNGDNLIIQNRAGGRDMKHESGTFITSPDENGRVTVEVGFKPEFLKVTLPFDSGDTYAVYDSLIFKDKTYWWIPMENSTRFYNIPDTGNGETGIVEITDTGFVFRSHAGNTRNVTCTYEAIMYIPVEGGGSKHSYSTEEQVVGTWVDGKPVYESVNGIHNDADLIFLDKMLISKNKDYEYNRGLIPILSSDIGPNGETICSGYSAGDNQAWHIFNNKKDVPENAWYHDINPCWVGYKFNEPTIVKSFYLMQEIATPVYFYHYKLQASNDGIDWVDLGSFECTHNEMGYIDARCIPNNIPYTHYRFYFLDHNTGSAGNGLSLQSAQFYDYPIVYHLTQYTKTTD